MFGKEYISLVAGLREYSLESEAKGLDLRAILEEIYEEFSSADEWKVRLLYGYYDCENIVSAFAGGESHNRLGQLSREQVEQVLRGNDDSTKLLPAEVVEVVESYASAESGAAGVALGFERELLAAYYRACAASKSRFIREWSAADCNLRNVAAAATARVMGRSVADVVVGEGDVVGQLTRSSAADFGLKGDYSYLDSVIAAVSDVQNIVDKERMVDAVRWTLIDELSEGEYFSAEFVLAYLAKINIIERWRGLSDEVGREMFARLMADLSGKDLIK